MDLSIKFKSLNPLKRIFAIVVSLTSIYARSCMSLHNDLVIISNNL